MAVRHSGSTLRTRLPPAPPAFPHLRHREAPGLASFLVDRVKRMDNHPKLNEDFRSRSVHGGVITLVASLLMLALFFSEYSIFRSVQTHTELMVETQAVQHLTVNFNITFWQMSCAVLEVVALDVSGDKHLDIRDESVHKVRLNAEGSLLQREVEKINEETLNVKHDHACGSCYGAEESPGDCCTTCEDVRNAYMKKGWALGDMSKFDQCKKDDLHKLIQVQQGEGCRVEGYVEVNRVAGNLHFAPGKSFSIGSQLVHDLSPFGIQEFNSRHTVHHLSFGQSFPGQINPLDVKNSSFPDDANMMHQYFLKVVPTEYISLHKNQKVGTKSILSNQYSVTSQTTEAEYLRGKGVPGVFFFYDFSPIKITYREDKSTLGEFLTSVCSIVGGVFAVSGIVNGSFHSILKRLDGGNTDSH